MYELSNCGRFKCGHYLYGNKSYNLKEEREFRLIKNLHRFEKDHWIVVNAPMESKA